MVGHRAAAGHGERSFEREFSGIKRFEPISRSYEGMVNILQVGRNDEADYFYYVMEVGDDQFTGQEFHPDTYQPKTLASQLSAAGRIPFAERVRLGVALSAALRHIHQQGLIHRDIKPSNIIFVGGRPKLADIGLVAEMSAARSFVDTEGFIPSEGPGSAPADIFSLGKVFYKISTGKDRHAFPELPSLLGDSLELKDLLELNEVVVKACATDVEKRHKSAEELHAELLLLQGGKSVKRLRLLERRLTHFIRSAAGALAVIAVAAIVWFQVSRERKRDAEMWARRVASYGANGAKLVDEGNSLTALPLFAASLRLDQDDPERSDVQRVRVASVLRRSPRLVQMWFQPDQVNDLQFSPDGRRLLVASGSRARVWNLADGQLASPEFKHSGLIESVAFSPDTARVLTGSGGKAQLWDAITGEKLFAVPGAGSLNSAKFSPDGRRLVTASEDNTAQVWDALTGKPEGGPLPHRSWVYHATFSPESRHVVPDSYDKSAQIWDAATGRAVRLPFLQPGDSSTGMIQCHHGWTRMVAEPNSGAFTPSL